MTIGVPNDDPGVSRKVLSYIQQIYFRNKNIFYKHNYVRVLKAHTFKQVTVTP